MKVIIRRSLYKGTKWRLSLVHVDEANVSHSEDLKMYLYLEPCNAVQEQHNTEVELLAEQIRAKKHLELQARSHGFSAVHKRLESFNAYFRKLADLQRGMNHHNWDSAVRYFALFRPEVRFVDLDLTLCEAFKAFLKSGPKLRKNRGPLQHNSALSYFNKFRTALKMAWREKLIADDLHNLSSGLKEKEALVEFLTMAEIKALLATPADNELCRRVVLFGILTGLRFADVKYLLWREVRGTPGEYYLQFIQKKTAKTQHMPVSDQAVELLGERGSPNDKVFQGLYYNQVRDFLVNWPLKAGISKHLTFTCLRHTYATLQLNNGTDIYTVSKMLGHRHVKTTQRYTRLLEDKKRETTTRIVLEF